MSVSDNGFGTFRGPNAGVWPPLERRGLAFPDMSNPRWFEEDPRFVWAFWKFRMDLYSSAQPHEGYHILKQWGQTKRLGMFSFTSNVDGHWLRVGGVPTYECHGTINYLQCCEPCSENDVFPTDFEAISKSLSFPSGVDDRVDGDLPLCPLCGALARPNVLMFGDWSYVSTLNAEQRKQFDGFLARSEGAKRCCIEIGAGSAVMTVRHAMQVASRGRSFIRIGFDEETQSSDANRVALKMGALEALQEIDHELQKLGGA